MLSSEENRISAYLNGDSPTISHKVTSDTPLEDLNLNWTEHDLPEKERTKHVHRLHPYLGKFIPQLVETFLRKYFKPGQTVLDPFCGSGTTLIQANELGINSIGFDVSDFNCLLSRAKSSRYNLVQVRKEVIDILEKTEKVTQAYNSPAFERKSYQLNLLEPAFPVDYQSYKSIEEISDREYLHQWFAPQTRHELLTYRNLILTEGYIYADLLKIILSRSARSSRLTTHFDLDFPKHPQVEPYWCYKHSRICQPTNEAFKFIKRYSIDTLRRLEEFSLRRTEASIEIYRTDSRQKLSPLIDGVITSPPYVGLIDYHEQHIYAYHLLGLEDNRDLEIGAAINGSSRKAQKQYQENIAQVFNKIAQTMPPGGRIIVIAGDKHNLYEKIAELAGVEIENIVQRQVNRRTGRRSGEFYESVFIWKKP